MESRINSESPPQIHEVKTTRKGWGIRVHTDKNFITILDQNEMNGLEILSKSGERINVHFPPSSFMVLTDYAMMVSLCQQYVNGVITTNVLYRDKSLFIHDQFSNSFPSFSPKPCTFVLNY